MPSVTYGTTTIRYEVERKPKLKNTYISVDKDGVLVKTNKSTTPDEIEHYVIKKSAWIVKHLRMYQTKETNINIVTGSRLFYLGKSYYVQVIEENIETVIVCFTHSKFQIHVPPKCTQGTLHKAVDEFYKDKATKKILPLVRKWSKLMGVTPAHVSFRKSEKRWASCSPTNRLSFNFDLMKISTSLIEYVVVHELSHIKHQNHSKEFWLEVKKHLPDYKMKEEYIKGFEKKL